MKIGIMGGTFNPIHQAHLILAERAYAALDLDKILFMPSKNPPHKKNEPIASDEDRSNMIELAIEDNPHFEFSDIELNREGYTYTADTLQELYLKEDCNEYYFIIGADSLMQIEQWNKPEIIMKFARLIVFRRDNLSEDLINQRVKYLEHKYHATIYYISIPNMDISSKMLRDMIANRISIKYYLPQVVINYINEKRLYQNQIAMKL